MDSQRLQAAGAGLGLRRSVSWSSTLTSRAAVNAASSRVLPITQLNSRVPLEAWRRPLSPGRAQAYRGSTARRDPGLTHSGGWGRSSSCETRNVLASLHLLADLTLM